MLFFFKYVICMLYGIGLGMLEMMEMVFWECGILCILFVFVVVVVIKVFGCCGDFYCIVGDKVCVIDGLIKYMILLYNEVVVFGFKDLDGVVVYLKMLIGGYVEVVVVDINDFGGNIFGFILDKVGE